MLELVVVLAVMGILLAIAVPTYSKYAQRAYRADAIRVLLAVAGCQERVRLVSGFYDTSLCIDHEPVESYRFRLEPAQDSAAERFTVFAEPLHTPGNSCGTLSLDHTGMRGISLKDSSATACWSGR